MNAKEKMRGTRCREGCEQNARDQKLETNGRQKRELEETDWRGQNSISALEAY